MSIDSSPISNIAADRLESWRQHNHVPAMAEHTGLWGDDGFDFSDILDIVNPLQHIPVLGTLYRSLTGDQMAPGARLAGGTIYGGPVGLISAMANVAFEEATGKDIGDMALSWFDDDKPSAPPTSLAAATRPEKVAALSPSASKQPIVEKAPLPVLSSAPAPAVATPTLSPAAFDVLTRSVGTTPSGPSVDASMSSGIEEASPEAGPGQLLQPDSHRGAALELHELLRQHTQSRKNLLGQ